jgi:adenosylmethionine-8-amino-7-oxononanoate aminotransferase
VIETNRVKATMMNDLVRPLSAHSRVRNFRNTGMIWAFEIDGTDAGIARRIHEHALARELLLRPIGRTVYFMPPYVISDDELELLVARTLEVVQSL